MADTRAIKGITVHDPVKAWAGYTLYTHTHEDRDLGKRLWAYPRLMDMEGNVVHEWRVGTAVQLLKLQPDGTLFYMTRDRSPIDEAGLYRLAPDSSILWTYHCRVDHDYYPLPNGNIIIHTITDNMCPRLGKGLRRHPYFVEITPDKELVWEWKGEEHIDELVEMGVLEMPIDWEGRIAREFDSRMGWDPRAQSLSPEQMEKSAAQLIHYRAFDWAHNNTCQVIGENAAGKVDPRFRPGNIVFSYRSLDIIGVIDRDSGEIVWAWGPGVIDGQHKPHMLPNGHILIFDNGTVRGWSSIVEMDPLTDTVVWEYTGTPKQSFYSGFISGAQRLPNDNTLICDGAVGRLFEVTMDKEIVWEFRSPYRGFINGGEAHNIYRTARYSEAYCQPLLG